MDRLETTISRVLKRCELYVEQHASDSSTTNDVDFTDPGERERKRVIAYLADCEKWIEDLDDCVDSGDNEGGNGDPEDMEKRAQVDSWKGRIRFCRAILSRKRHQSTLSSRILAKKEQQTVPAASAVAAKTCSPSKPADSARKTMSTMFVQSRHSQQLRNRLFGEDLPAKTEQIESTAMDQHHRIHEDLTKSIARMSETLLSQSKSIGSQLDKDHGALDDAEHWLHRNLAITNSQNKRMNEYNHRQWGGTLTWFLMLFAVIVIFAGTLILMRIISPAHRA